MKLDLRYRPGRLSAVVALLTAAWLTPIPAQADDFPNDVKRTFTTDIPHFFQDDIPVPSAASRRVVLKARAKVRAMPRQRRQRNTKAQPRSQRRRTQTRQMRARVVELQRAIHPLRMPVRKIAGGRC